MDQPVPRFKPREKITTRPLKPDLAALYAEKWTSFDAMRQAMVAKGIVEHGLSAYEVLQRAIDDVTTDYLLVRRHIDKETGTVNQQYEHELREYMEHLRECMVRYSTLAIQYDIQRRALKISETRVAVLAVTLKQLLREMGLTQDQITEVPKRLTEIIRSQHGNELNSYRRLTNDRVTALAEILDGEADVEIIDVEPGMEDADDRRMKRLEMYAAQRRPDGKLPVIEYPDVTSIPNQPQEQTNGHSNGSEEKS